MGYLVVQLALVNIMNLKLTCPLVFARRIEVVCLELMISVRIVDAAVSLVHSTLLQVYYIGRLVQLCQRYIASASVLIVNEGSATFV